MIAWHQAAARAFKLYQDIAGLSGKELLEAQNENYEYQTTFARYKAHLHECAECHQLIFGDKHELPVTQIRAVFVTKEEAEQEVSSVPSQMV